MQLDPLHDFGEREVPHAVVCNDMHQHDLPNLLTAMIYYTEQSARCTELPTRTAKELDKGKTEQECREPSLCALADCATPRDWRTGIDGGSR
jgi:hypothetical protein